jgi:hypothetical protein
MLLLFSFNCDEWVQHLPEDEREEACKDPRVRVALLPDGFQWLQSSHPTSSSETVTIECGRRLRKPLLLGPATEF